MIEDLVFFRIAYLSYKSEHNTENMKFSQIGIVFITFGFQIDFPSEISFPMGKMRIYFPPITLFNLMKLK